mgnify:FL=1
MRLGYALTGNNKAKLANERERERESKRASERIANGLHTNIATFHSGIQLEEVA